MKLRAACLSTLAALALLAAAKDGGASTGPTLSVDTGTSDNTRDFVGTIEPCVSVAGPGTQFTIDVVIENVQSLSGFEADLFYNAGVVTVTGANASYKMQTGFFFDLSDPVPDDDGRYHILLSTSGQASGEGIIIRLTLTGDANGTTELNLANVKMKDYNNNYVQPSDSNGWYIGPVNDGAAVIGGSCADADADGVPDASDNCPLTPNPGQADYDGDGAGDACDTEDDGDAYTDVVEAGAPLCGNGRNDDSFDDSTLDDGCPGGPAATGLFSEGQFRIGTNPLDHCGLDAWPSDFVSGGVPDSTNRITLTDITSFVAPASSRRLDTSPWHANYNRRWDLLPGPGLFANWININDLTALVAGPTAYPPMLGGQRALNGPACG